MAVKGSCGLNGEGWGIDPPPLMLFPSTLKRLLHRHGRLDVWVGIVVLQFEVLVTKGVKVLDIRVEAKTRQRTPYVPSPLLYKGGLYFLRHYQGILTRLDAVSGKEPSGPFRLGGVSEVYASPVAAAGRIYITDRRGATIVLSGDLNPKFIARNVLDDSFSASAAIVGKELFLRGTRKLYCIAREKPEK